VYDYYLRTNEGGGGEIAGSPTAMDT